jgi:hypothetical protein
VNDREDGQHDREQNKSPEEHRVQVARRFLHECPVNCCHTLMRAQLGEYCEHQPHSRLPDAGFESPGGESTPRGRDKRQTKAPSGTYIDGSRTHLE